MLVPPEDRTRLVELKEAVGPEGEIVAARLTVPVNPLMLFKVTVLLPDPPTGTVNDVGLREMV